MNVFLQKALCKRQRPDLLSCGSLSLLIPPPHAPSSVKLMSDRTSYLNPSMSPRNLQTLSEHLSWDLPTTSSPGSNFPITPVIPANSQTIFFPHSALYCLICATFLSQIYGTWRTIQINHLWSV